MTTPTEYRNLMIQEGIKTGMDHDELSQFIANLEHECAGFTRFEENLNYRPERLLEIFGPKKRADGTMSKGRNGLTTLSDANRICKGGKAGIAEAIYGGDWGKKYLGNLFIGDGLKYAGKGPIQLTGRSNFTIYANLTGIDLVNHPEYILDPKVGSKVAVAFWIRSGASKAAKIGDYKTARIKVNGGTLGYDEIQKHAKAYLADTAIASMYKTNDSLDDNDDDDDKQEELV
jgi:putative chitinase